MSRFFSKAFHALSHLFKERQIYHRSDGVVRFLKLSRRKQVIGAVITLALMLWFAYASVNVGLQRSINLANEKEFRRTIDIYRDQLRRSETAYNSINELNEIFSREYESAISKVESRHEALRRLVESQNRSREELSGFAQSLSEAEGPNRRKLKDGGNRVMIDPFGREPTPRQNRTSRIRQKSIRSAATSNLSRGVKNDVLANMQQSTAELLSEQAFALAALEANSEKKIEELEKIIGSTGIPKSALVLPAVRAYATRRAEAYADRAVKPGSDQFAETPGRVDRNDNDHVNQILNGQGGSFIARGDFFNNAVQRIESNLEEAEVIASLISRMPVSSPITEHYKITSEFGKRRTPNGLKRRSSGRLEDHYGLDLANKPHCPIVATAPGRVKKVVRSSSGYGNQVIIDHGNGFETLYAHLSKIKVSKGQKVALHDTIGLMGTSGRSNGFHVHYEVRFNGKALDPMKFIEAGRYVFES